MIHKTVFTEPAGMNIALNSAPQPEQDIYKSYTKKAQTDYTIPEGKMLSFLKE